MCKATQRFTIASGQGEEAIGGVDSTSFCPGKAVREAVDATGEEIILVARTEGLLCDSTAISTAIDKLAAFADAGADCLCAPRMWRRTDIQEMARAVSPMPLNVLALGADLDFHTLADLGTQLTASGAIT